MSATSTAATALGGNRLPSRNTRPSDWWRFVEWGVPPRAEWCRPVLYCASQGSRVAAGSSFEASGRRLVHSVLRD